MSLPHKPYAPSSISIVDKMKRASSLERVFMAQIDAIMLKSANLISEEELISLYKMIKSPDEENLVLVEEIIKSKIDNYKPTI